MSFRGQPPPPQPSQRFLGGLWQSAFARWRGHDHHEACRAKSRAVAVL